MVDYYKNRFCRLCKSRKMRNVFNLNPSPLANAFRKNILIKNKHYPLNIYLCLDCKHLQLVNIVNPKILFSNYLYSSGASQVYIDHLKKYSDSLIIKYDLNNKIDSICDIGSNDGIFLHFFKKKGFKVLGIEPSKNLSTISKKRGIKTKNNFFDSRFVILNKKLLKSFKVITTNHVFAHVKNIQDFTLSVQKLLKDDGIFIFEVGYLADVIKNKYFDTIYHEHLDYHHFQPLKKFFYKFNMKIIYAEKTKTQGGSIRIHVVQKSNRTLSTDYTSINKIIKLENKLQLSKIQTYQVFFQKVQKQKTNFLNLIKYKKLKNKIIIGYGATAKATTFLSFFEMPKNLIKVIIDDSNIKENYFMPGYDIQIKKFDYMYKIKFDYIIIFAWNFSDSIIDKLKKIKNRKFKIISLFPVVKIFSI